MHLWDLRTGEGPQTLTRPDTVSSIDWGPDDRLVLSSFDGSIAVFDPQGEPVITYEESAEHIVEEIDVSPDGRLIAAAINHERNPLRAAVSIRNSETGSLEALFLAPAHLAGVEFDPSGKFIVMATFSGEIQVWNVADERRILVPWKPWHASPTVNSPSAWPASSWPAAGPHAWGRRRQLSTNPS